MKKNYTHISILLDKSGSMHGLIDDTIGGYNSLIEDQKREVGTATVSLDQFSYNSTNVYSFVDVNEVRRLSKANYKPSGGTALYDALSDLIDDTGRILSRMPERQRPSKVLIAVITDGEENCSKKTTASALKSKIEHQSGNYNWEFVFIGSNQDAVLSARKIGIAATHAFTYENTSLGTMKGYTELSCNVSNLRKGKSINFTTSTGTK